MTAERTARLGHLVVAVVVTVALLLQLVLAIAGASVLQPETDPGLAVRLVRLVSYFTIQSNLLVAITSWILARDPGRDGPIWRVVRLDAIVGIVVTGLVHWFLLRPLLDLHGASAVSDTLLHIVSPLLAVIAWVLLGPRGRLSGRTVAAALIWPAAWTVSTLIVGAVTGWYPYPFLNPGPNGAGPVIVAVLGIAALIILIAVICWLLDRALPWGVRDSVSSKR